MVNRDFFQFPERARADAERPLDRRAQLGERLRQRLRHAHSQIEDSFLANGVAWAQGVRTICSRVSKDTPTSPRMQATYATDSAEEMVRETNETERRSCASELQSSKAETVTSTSASSQNTIRSLTLTRALLARLVFFQEEKVSDTSIAKDTSPFSFPFSFLPL